MGRVGIHGILLGFHGILLGFHVIFLGLKWDFLGMLIHGIFLGFYWNSNGTFSRDFSWLCSLHFSDLNHQKYGIFLIYAPQVRLH